MERLIVAAVAAGLVLFGVIFKIVAGIIKKIVRGRMDHCTVKVTARVLGFVSDERRAPNGDYATYYHPVYEYLANGELMQVQSYAGIPKNRFKAGQSVELFYNPGNPEEYYCEAEKVSFIHKVFDIIAYIVWGVSILLLILALFVL